MDSLLAKAAQKFGVRQRCPHTHTTLCQHTDPTYGWFVAYQCDDCGMVTRQDVSADQLTLPDLPPVDAELWEQAVEACDHDLVRTLTFISQAVLR